MLALQRHDLVRIAPAAWSELIREQVRSPEASGLLSLWCAHDWPLVVTRRPASLRPDQVALGLPAPKAWGSPRLAMTVPRNGIVGVGRFPPLSELPRPAAARFGLASFCRAFEAAGLDPRVFGSFGWQAITGLACTDDDSDLDLLIPVRDWTQAELAVEILSAASCPVRLDGELVFALGRAVAWREFDQLRRGATHRVLVKDVDAVRLVDRRGLEHGADEPCLAV